MSENPASRKIANDTAEKVLAAIYGEDLQGCNISLDTVAGIIQEGVDSGTKNYKMLNEALIGALRQIQTVSTPPPKEEIQSLEEAMAVLSERADAIHQVTTKILEAWERAEGQI